MMAGQTPKGVFDRAVAALRASDYAAAEAGFLEVLQGMPGHLGALQNLGLVYSKTGRLEQSVATYRRALELSPGNRGLLLNLGLALMKRGAYDEAIPVIEELVRSHMPGAPGAFLLCQIYSEAGRFDEAVAQCRKTLAAQWDFPGAHRELGKALVGQHSPDAIGELKLAVLQSADDPQAAYYLGVVLSQEDRYGEAAASLERALRLDPGFWGAYFYLGKARLKLGQGGQTIPLLQKAAALNPTAPMVFYELGLALKASGRNEEAGRAMDRVRELRAAEVENDIKLLEAAPGKR
jgi:tetratricopeptide (TPR) repeat protein